MVPDHFLEKPYMFPSHIFVGYFKVYFSLKFGALKLNLMAAQYPGVTYFLLLGFDYILFSF